mmetsp:Transcript_30709/g.69901  ORF Transcript_30709/g.69901 Transcript_30709/m.69901 type:complete len:391 (-) Transcript_30709:35-1207(-)
MSARELPAGSGTQPGMARAYSGPLSGRQVPVIDASAPAIGQSVAVMGGYPQAQSIPMNRVGAQSVALGAPTASLFPGMPAPTPPRTMGTTSMVSPGRYRPGSSGGPPVVNGVPQYAPVAGTGQSLPPRSARQPMAVGQSMVVGQSMAVGQPLMMMQSRAVSPPRAAPSVMVGALPAGAPIRSQAFMGSANSTAVFSRSVQSVPRVAAASAPVQRATPAQAPQRAAATAAPAAIGSKPASAREAPLVVQSSQAPSSKRMPTVYLEKGRDLERVPIQHVEQLTNFIVEDARMQEEDTMRRVMFVEDLMQKCLNHSNIRDSKVSVQLLEDTYQAASDDNKYTDIFLPINGQPADWVNKFKVDERRDALQRREIRTGKQNADNWFWEWVMDPVG